MEKQTEVICKSSGHVQIDIHSINGVETYLAKLEDNEKIKLSLIKTEKETK